MRLTVDLPWFTHSRRLAIMVIAMLLLLALAVPASATPPEALREVTVANDEANPVPVTLDANPAGHLADIDASTESLSYDANGNLNVNISNGSTTPIANYGPIGRLSDGAGHFSANAGSPNRHPVPAGFLLTALSASAGDAINLMIQTPDGLGYVIPVPTGSAAYHDFTFPIAVDKEILVHCVGASFCEYYFGAIGYVP